MKDTLNLFLIVGGTLFGVHYVNKYIEDKVEDGVRREREAFEAMHKKDLDDAYHKGYTDGYECARHSAGNYNK